MTAQQAAPPAGAPLSWRLLRRLTVDPGAHPRGQPHLSAASGLVCELGRVYVIADDEHHLAVFTDARAPGVLHRLVAGDLPAPKDERKRRKPDLETLMWLPAGALERGSGAALLALGSGSTSMREHGFVVPVQAGGEPMAAATREIDLAPLFGPLRARLGDINIEGAFCLGDEFVLLHRGGDGQRGSNAIARYAWPDVLPLWRGERGGEIAPGVTHLCDLGQIAGVSLGFTDGAAWTGAGGGGGKATGKGAGGGTSGGFLFTAVAEDSADSIADGACRGSVIGLMQLDGRLRWLRRLRGAPKVEGLAVHTAAGSATLCLVTDADDPARSSLLLQAQWMLPEPA